MKKKRRNEIRFLKSDLVAMENNLNKAMEINLQYNVYNKFLSKKTKEEIRKYHKMLTPLTKQIRKVADLAVDDYNKTKNTAQKIF